MKCLSFLLLACLAGPVLHGALAELNPADATIESPDGLFVGRDFSVAKNFKLELLHVSKRSEEHTSELQSH